MDKKGLSGRGICAKFIAPVLGRADWNLCDQVREEVTLTRGRAIGRSRPHADSGVALFIHRCLAKGHGGRWGLLHGSFGAKPGLNLQDIKEPSVPAPPVEERRRIVAKVRELLTLRVQCKARIAAARAKHAQLAAALVADAVEV